MTSTSAGSEDEQRLRRQVVGHDDVGLRDRPPAAHGDQSRIARAAADQDDGAAPPAGRRAGDAVGDAAVGQPGDDGVAHADGPLRVPARRARRRPGRRAARSPASRRWRRRRSSARAQKIRAPLGLLGHGGVHRAGRRWRPPRTRRRRGRPARTDGGSQVSEPGATSASSAGVTSGLTTVTRAPASSSPATRRCATWPPPTTTTRRSAVAGRPGTRRQEDRRAGAARCSAEAPRDGCVGPGSQDARETQRRPLSCAYLTSWKVTSHAFRYGNSWGPGPDGRGRSAGRTAGRPRAARRTRRPALVVRPGTGRRGLPARLGPLAPGRGVVVLRGPRRRDRRARRARPHLPPDHRRLGLRPPCGRDPPGHPRLARRLRPCRRGRGRRGVRIRTARRDGGGGRRPGVAVTFLGRWWTRLYVAELRGEL